MFCARLPASTSCLFVSCLLPVPAFSLPMCFVIPTRLFVVPASTSLQQLRPHLGFSFPSTSMNESGVMHLRFYYLVYNFFIRSSWRISKSYSRCCCCCSSSSCGVFLFHSLQFSSKLPETWYMYVKIRCTDSNHLRF